MRTRIIHAIVMTLPAAAAALAATAAQNGRAETTNKAVVTLVANQHSVAVTRGFSLVQDEPASVAGGARGPTPTDYFMAARSRPA